MALSQQPRLAKRIIPQANAVKRGKATGAAKLLQCMLLGSEVCIRHSMPQGMTDGECVSHSAWRTLTPIYQCCRDSQPDTSLRASWA